MQSEDSISLGVTQRVLGEHVGMTKVMPEMDEAKCAVIKQMLPAPLTEQLLSSAMSELNQGTARAVQSCLECFRDNRMSGEDLVSFIRSISMQSKTLTEIYQKEADASAASKDVDMGEAAGADDLAELMALAGGSLAAPVPSVHVSAPPFQPASNPTTATPDTSCRTPPAPRARKAKVVEPSDEEMRLMLWWAEKRVPEITRRQHETARCDQLATPTERDNAYVRFLMTKLVGALPTAGNLKLLQHVRAFNDTLDIAAFGASVKGLVDEFDIKISLDFAPECDVRAAPAGRRRKPSASISTQRAIPAIDLGDLHGDTEGMDGLWPSVEADVKSDASAAETHRQPDVCCAHPVTAGQAGKRKRTETLNGANPEDEDEMASCPVCKNEPREDDRWVKCDGCGSWYHQICVLFNEIAHGKSVRFFCRTPGCRKRGSRQLNRRQRKPSYPTAPAIETSALGEWMTSQVAPVSRTDRDVVIKMVANTETSREIKMCASGRAGQRQSQQHSKMVERVRAKTLCAFQHTLIGSDLLFLVMFVEEIIGADGVGRVEVKRVGVNGFYEEARAGEAKDVEHAIVTAYLRHAAAQGFSSARLHLSGSSAAAASLFCGAPAPSHVVMMTTVASCVELLRCAHEQGVVTSYQQDRQGEVVRAVLHTSGQMRTEKDIDITCPLAQNCAEWLKAQENHCYRFDDIQFAKFSSMMLVYHLIKGWKKEFTVPPRPTSDRPAPAPALSAADTEEGAMDAEVGAFTCLARLSKKAACMPGTALCSPALQTMPSPGLEGLAYNIKTSERVPAMPCHTDALRACTPGECVGEAQGISAFARDVQYMLQIQPELPFYDDGSSSAQQHQQQQQQQQAVGSSVQEERHRASSPLLLSFDSNDNDDFWADALNLNSDGSNMQTDNMDGGFWDCFLSSLS
jgi:hypothetical protein